MAAAIFVSGRDAGTSEYVRVGHNSTAAKHTRA